MICRPLLLILCALILCGCSPDEGTHKVYPVSGSVKVDGQPVAGAQVTLLGTTDELKGANAAIPFGTTDDLGNFTLRTYAPGDGAPAGTYNVKVIWPETPPPGADTEMYEAKDRLKGRYAEPEKSGLTATIEAKTNVLPPFDLKK